MVVLCRDGLGRVYSSKDSARTFRRCFVLLTSPHRQSTTSGLLRKKEVSPEDYSVGLPVLYKQGMLVSMVTIQYTHY